MKRTSLLLAPLFLLIVSCTSNHIEPDNKPLSEYNLSYLENDLISKYVCEEFKASFEEELNVTSINSVDTNKYSIYFNIDSALENKFSIQHVNNSIIASSDSINGLMDAARKFRSDVVSDELTIKKTLYINKYESSSTPIDKAKIMTFNVRVSNDGTLGNGDKGDVVDRAPRVVATILNHMPDTVGVQEANDNWLTYLKNGLCPQYEYIGNGRESNLKGESTGIFYNKDRVVLLEGGTKWLSDTPEVPGSKFDVAGEYFRIFSYGIFKRISDGLIYMHVNSHFDLQAPARLKDAECINNFIEPYRNKMPIFSTADYNCEINNSDDGVYALVNQYGFSNVMDEASDVSAYHTFPQDGYKETEVNNCIIDYCLKANRGLFFTKYLVDKEKYSGDGVERPQLSSDHYPVYFEAIPYAPIIPFDDYENYGDIDIDNSFSMHNAQFDSVANNSNYEHMSAILASKSLHNGNLITSKDTRTKYSGVTGLSATNGLIEYQFTSNSEQGADLNLIIASSKYNYDGMKNLASYIDITLNGEAIDISNINLRCLDIRQKYEWENLVIRDQTLINGENSLVVRTKNNVAPDHLLLEVFSNEEVTQIEGEDTIEKTSFINLGTKTISVYDFNKMYQNQVSSVIQNGDNKELTINLKDGLTTSIEDLDGIFNLTRFSQVSVTGNGTLSISYSVESDGIEAYSFIVSEGATVNLIGRNSTQKSGIKIYKLLQVDGTFNISNFYCGHAIAKPSGASAPYDVAINVGLTGRYNISNCSNGIYAWSSFNKNVSVTVYGELIISVYSEKEDTTSANYGCGINLLKTGSTLTVFGTLDINATNSLASSSKDYGFGINVAQGSIYFRDNAIVNINSSGTAIYNFYRLIVAGSNDGQTTGHVRLTCKSAFNGINSSKTSNGRCSIAFNTDGDVLIENTSETPNKTAIQISNKGQSGDLFMFKCANMTIKGFNYVMYSGNLTKVQNCTYEYTNGFNKIKVINCNKLWNSDTGNNNTFFSLFSEDTMDISE